jgi:hypothetical protein
MTVHRRDAEAAEFGSGKGFSKNLDATVRYGPKSLYSTLRRNRFYPRGLCVSAVILYVIEC